MKFLAFLVLFSAIAIASCAAYFSIVGLKLLFVGSGLSIVVMGVALEVGKFIAVTFLKQKWEDISLALKTYLMAATIVLMGITSVGIYGYLSAGYNATALKVQSIEQAIQGNLNRIEYLKDENLKLEADPVNQKEIDLINANKITFTEQQLKLIESKELKLKQLRDNENVNNKSTQDLQAAKNALDAEKATLDLEINKELEQIKLYNNRLGILDEEVQSWLKQGNRGFFKTNGADKAREVKLAQEKERQEIDNKIKERQDRIQVLRDEYKTQVETYNKRVTVIESRVSSQNKFFEEQINQIEKEINQTKQNILDNNTVAESSLSQLLVKKQSLIETNKKQITDNEATINEILITNNTLKEQIIKTDVGTFKFVAESIGWSLNKTVTYFIGAIMLVFDPLAVCLVLCFNYLIKDISNKKKVERASKDQSKGVSIDTLILPTSAPSTPEESITMKSSEIIFGQKREKQKHPAPEGEVKRLEEILEQQRKEKAERDAKKQQP